MITKIINNEFLILIVLSGVVWCQAMAASALVLSRRIVVSAPAISRCSRGCTFSSLPGNWWTPVVSPLFFLSFFHSATRVLVSWVHITFMRADYWADYPCLLFFFTEVDALDGNYMSPAMKTSIPGPKSLVRITISWGGGLVYVCLDIKLLTRVCVFVCFVCVCVSCVCVCFVCVCVSCACFVCVCVFHVRVLCVCVCVCVFRLWLTCTIICTYLNHIGATETDGKYIGELYMCITNVLCIIDTFSENSHLIKCVSYAYIAPTLHPLIGGCTNVMPTGWRKGM